LHQVRVDQYQLERQCSGIGVSEPLKSVNGIRNNHGFRPPTIKNLAQNGSGGRIIIDNQDSQSIQGVGSLRSRRLRSFPGKSKVRSALDLDADATAIDAHLAASGFSADVARDPAVRLPGAIDPFEVAIRAVIGQQVTVKAATTIVGRLVDLLGEPIETPETLGLDRLFPTAERIAEAGARRIASLGMPLARGEAVHRLATAVATGKLTLARGAIAAGRAGLAELPGIGPWTIEYVSLRALGDPDAFPLGDSALRAAFDGDLRRACEAWRPWRGYAAARLWRRPVTQRTRKAA
jgi:3-methyladenine DNA glycosylase/8-oxoguanine DNA glycosylase